MLLKSLEGLRFIASLGIVAIHMLPHYGIEVAHGLNLFVDMFFVISGIVIGNIYIGKIGTISQYGHFIRRRLARIYPLHLATLLLYIAIGAAIIRYGLPSDRDKFDPHQILPNLLLIHAWGDGKLSFNFVSWSVSAEFLLYLLFPVTSWLVTRRPVAGGLVVAALAIGAIAWSERIYGAPLTDLRWNYGSVRALPSFALGLWLASFAGRALTWRHARWSGLAFSIAAVAAAVEIAAGTSDYILLATLWFLVATGFISDLQGLPTFASWKPLSDRGYLTYSLYMLHVPVSTVFVSFLFPKLLGHGPAGQAISLAGALVVLFVGAHLSFRLFEDPLRRWLR